jgi:hypothetical protein
VPLHQRPATLVDGTQTIGSGGPTPPRDKSGSLGQKSGCVAPEADRMHDLGHAASEPKKLDERHGILLNLVTV